MKKEIISVDWLKNNLTDRELVILDASPKSTISGDASLYVNACIPNSRAFNIKEKFTDKTSQFPNTIPSPEQFEKECQLLGINANSKIVVYDNLGIYTSPRVWWLFKVMGHEKVWVLDGGLPEWDRAGGEMVEKGNANEAYEKGNFKSDFQKKYLVKYNDIIDNIESKKFLVVDARSEGRFLGTDPEPRKHLKSGCIPNSVNIPYKTLLEDGKFKSKEELRNIFESRISEEQQLVFSCGSGLTACIVMLASEIAFGTNKYLYDGSWTEYAELSNLKVEE